MIKKLTYLVFEINAALEIYISGRTGQQYNRTSYILCDDATELTSKLYLLVDCPTWSDTKSGGHFKNYRDITTEVRALFLAKRHADHPAADTLLKRMEGRRKRRNEFFHSTTLLDLNLHARDCVEAFIDLFDYAKLCFRADWDTAVTLAGNMETCETILRLDKKSYADPSVFPKLNALLGSLPRQGPKARAKGCEIALHAEDLHLRLAIRNGGKPLRDKLRLLL
jgi:hypothetical protein